jgi:hypothetical protein
VQLVQHFYKKVPAKETIKLDPASLSGKGMSGAAIVAGASLI